MDEPTQNDIDTTIQNLKDLLPSGKPERISSILECGKVLLREEGYQGFSMRKVATMVGMSLGNLQQYFRTKDDLISGVLVQVALDYNDIFLKIFSSLRGRRKEKLRAFIQYLLEDNKKPETAKLFCEIWALSVRHNFARTIFQLSYNRLNTILSGLIHECCPDLSVSERYARCTQIMAMIDGHVLFLSPLILQAENSEEIIDRAVASAMEIALAPLSNTVSES